MDITVIIQAFIALVAAIITAVLVPYVKSKTTAEQQQDIMWWVRTAVSAAEQIYRGSGMGATKKAFVIKWLTDRNITFDVDKIEIMLEDAVREMNSEKQNV